METTKLIKLSKDMSKEISYFFYRLNKIYYMIEDLIGFVEFQQRSDVQDMKASITIDSHISLITEDLRDLSGSIKSFYGTDILDSNYVKMFQDLFFQKSYTNIDKEFEQHWYHSIQLIIECFRVFRDDMSRLSDRNGEVNNKLYYAKFDQLLKNRIGTLLEDASTITAMIYNNILIPIGSINPRGF